MIQRILHNPHCYSTWCDQFKCRRRRRRRRRKRGRRWENDRSHWQRLISRHVWTLISDQVNRRYLNSLQLGFDCDMLQRLLRKCYRLSADRPRTRVIFLNSRITLKRSWLESHVKDMAHKQHTKNDDRQTSKCCPYPLDFFFFFFLFLLLFFFFFFFFFFTRPEMKPSDFHHVIKGAMTSILATYAVTIYCADTAVTWVYIDTDLQLHPGSHVSQPANKINLLNNTGPVHKLDSFCRSSRIGHLNAALWFFFHFPTGYNRAREGGKEERRRRRGGGGEAEEEEEEKNKSEKKNEKEKRSNKNQTYTHTHTQSKTKIICRFTSVNMSSICRAKIQLPFPE